MKLRFLLGVWSFFRDHSTFIHWTNSKESFYCWILHKCFDTLIHTNHLIWSILLNNLNTRCCFTFISPVKQQCLINIQCSVPKPYCSNVLSFKINATCFDIFSRMQWHSSIFKCDWGVHILYFLRERRIWVKVVWCCIIHERCCFRRTALGLSEEISSSQVFVSQRWSFERRYWAKMKRRSVTHTNDTPLSHTQTQCQRPEGPRFTHTE